MLDYLNYRQFDMKVAYFFHFFIFFDILFYSQKNDSTFHFIK